MATTRPPLPLLGKLALISGSSRGLGAGFALELAQRGADIAITYTSAHSTPLVTELSSQISSLAHSPRVYNIQSDLSTVAGADKILVQLKQQRPDLKLHILVNNAGAEVVKPLREITLEDYAKVFDLNVRGTVLLTQAVLPYLVPGGRIINVSSVGARAGFAALGLYCASKAAVEGLSRCWAAELGGDGTTVNVVAPGPVESEMLEKIPREIVEMQMVNTPLQNRVGTVDDVAKIVGWLAGEESRWVTGQVISASGGWAMY